MLMVDFAAQVRFCLPELEYDETVRVAERLAAVWVRDLSGWVTLALDAQQATEFVTAADAGDLSPFELLEETWSLEVRLWLEAMQRCLILAFVEDHRHLRAVEFPDFDPLGDLGALFPDLDYATVAGLSGVIRRQHVAVADDPSRTPGASWKCERYGSTIELAARTVQCALDHPTTMLNALDRFRSAGFISEAALCAFDLGSDYLSADDPATAAEHFGVALSLYSEACDTDGVADSAFNLGVTLVDSGDHDAAQGAYRIAIEHYEAARNRHRAATATMNLGNAKTFAREYDDAAETFEQAYRLAVEVDVGLAAACAANLANVAIARRRPSDVYAFGTTAIDHYVNNGNSQAAASLGLQLGEYLKEQHRLDDALKVLHRAANLYWLRRDRTAGIALSVIADVHLNRQDYQRALAIHGDARRIYTEVGDGVLLAMNDCDLADVYVQLGQYGQAEELYRGAMGYPGAMASSVIVAITRGLGRLFWLTHRLDDAKGALEAAEYFSVRVGQPQIAPYCRFDLGSVALLQGDRATAIDAYQRVRDHCKDSDDLFLDARAVQGLAMLRLDEPEVAIRLLNTALHKYRALGVRRGEAECNRAAGALHFRHGRHVLAWRRLEDARSTFSDLGIVKEVAVCDLAKARCAASANADLREPGAAPKLSGVLDLAIPAMVTLDRMKYQFDRADARIAWSAVVEEARADVFSWVEATGDAELLAQLIEYAINAGVYTAAHESAVQAWTTLNASDRPEMPDQEDSRVWVSAQTIADRRLLQRSIQRTSNAPTIPWGHVGRLIADARLPMNPPQPLLMPNGRIALGQYVELAAERYDSGPRVTMN